ncbi:hypothetical protein SLE2022_314210 [Rubroshorea leprosula]
MQLFFPITKPPLFLRALHAHDFLAPNTISAADSTLRSPEAHASSIRALFFSSIRLPLISLSLPTPQARTPSPKMQKSKSTFHLFNGL